MKKTAVISLLLSLLCLLPGCAKSASDEEAFEIGRASCRERVYVLV